MSVLVCSKQVTTENLLSLDQAQESMKVKDPPHREMFHMCSEKTDVQESVHFFFVVIKKVSLDLL